MPVVGSRHYVGPGLGEAMWKCPACGAENQGPIAQGCGVCGAGSPGQKVEPPPPPPPSAEENVFTRWAATHPDATIEDAFTAGYIEGVRDARRELRAAAPPAAEATLRPEGIINRTIIAALELFRDQVLSGAPEEVRTGEWLSARAVDDLLGQLRAHEEELTHA